jgi:hypothetical protein
VIVCVSLSLSLSLSLSVCVCVCVCLCVCVCVSTQTFWLIWGTKRLQSQLGSEKRILRLSSALRASTIPCSCKGAHTCFFCFILRISNIFSFFPEFPVHSAHPLFPAAPARAPGPFCLFYFQNFPCTVHILHFRMCACVRRLCEKIFSPKVSALLTFNMLHT